MTFVSRPLRDRLVSRITVDEKTGCWNFPTSKGQGGYGTIDIGGHRMRKAHRVAYELFRNVTLDRSTHLHHACENTACCNPDHLQPTTPAEHNAQLSPRNFAFQHRQKTHCKNGHPLSGDNVSVETHHGKRLVTRVCITCRREAARRWYARDDNAAKLAQKRAERRQQTA